MVVVAILVVVMMVRVKMMVDEKKYDVNDDGLKLMK